MLGLKIIAVNKENIFLLENFIASLGVATKTFRYFTTRNLTALKNHFSTLLVVDDEGVAVGYGHLDKDADIVWVGIAVLPNHQGKQIGTMMMKKILEVADSKGINSLHASIDVLNVAIKRLLEKHGFVQLRTEGSISYYKRDLNSVISKD